MPPTMCCSGGTSGSPAITPAAKAPLTAPTTSGRPSTLCSPAGSLLCWGPLLDSGPFACLLLLAVVRARRAVLRPSRCLLGKPPPCHRPDGGHLQLRAHVGTIVPFPRSGIGVLPGASHPHTGGQARACS